MRAIAFDDVLEIAKGVSRARSRTPSAACTSTYQRAGPTLQERQLHDERKSGYNHPDEERAFDSGDGGHERFS